LCNLSREYLNALIFKFYTFYSKNSETCDILCAYLPLTITVLSTLNNSAFLAILYSEIAYSIHHVIAAFDPL